MKIAIVTFVKTPGMSPIKTRLAASIGRAEALQFYVQSLGATYKMIEDLRLLVPHVQPYWALAEKQALGSVFWEKWPQLWQGDGGLGERIAHVHSTLRESFDVVALYGADSPHIPAERLADGLRMIISGDAQTVVGPTEDGGFYFLASSLRVSADVWRKVTYSCEQTLAELKNAWPDEMRELVKDFDVDTLEDLRRLPQSLMH